MFIECKAKTRQTRDPRDSPVPSRGIAQAYAASLDAYATSPGLAWSVGVRYSAGWCGTVPRVSETHTDRDREVRPRYIPTLVSHIFRLEAEMSINVAV